MIFMAIQPGSQPSQRQMGKPQPPAAASRSLRRWLSLATLLVR